MSTPATRYSASTIPLCNMILGLLIIAQVPIMFDIVSGDATIGIIPWVLCAYPVIIVCVVMMFRNGDFVDGTLNGVLSAILMGQNAIVGFIWLAYSASGQVMPESVSLGMSFASGMAFLCGGIILLPMAYLAFQGNKIGGVCIFCGGVAFLGLFAMYMGAGTAFAMVGAIGLTILAVYLLISGIVMVFQTVGQAANNSELQVPND